MYYSCIKFKDVLVRRFHYVSERFQTLFYPGDAGIVHEKRDSVFKKNIVFGPIQKSVQSVSAAFD